MLSSHKYFVINIILLILPVKSAEEKIVPTSSYVSICVGSLQKEVDWLLKNIDPQKLSDKSEKAIMERTLNSLEQIKKIACNPDYEDITYTVKNRERIKAEISLKFEDKINNAVAALLGFDASLSNNASFKDKVKAMKEHLETAHTTLLVVSK